MLAEAVRWGVIAVILLCAAIGFLFLTRGTAVRRVRAVGTDAEPVAPTAPEFPLSVTARTCAASSWTGAWDGRAGSASTTSGWATATRYSPSR